jgi:adenine-specific DNA-methyltransferase
MGLGRAYLVLEVNKEFSYKGIVDSKNMIIQGDNAPVMNYLMNGSYNLKESVDFMLWDPPYNAGNKHFMYNDGFARSEWLSFMKERLLIARIMLKESGSIAVHIGHRELFRLGVLMDELFGEKNRVAIVNWECSYSTKNDCKGITSTTDYVLIYAKHKKALYRQLLPRTKEMDDIYNKSDRGRSFKNCDPFVRENLSAPGRKTKAYGIENPYTGKIIYPTAGRGWRIKIEKMIEFMNLYGVPYVKDATGNCVISQGSNRENLKKFDDPSLVILFSRNGIGGIRRKVYLSDLKIKGRVLGTFLDSKDIDDNLSISLQHEESGHNAGAKRLLKAILGGDTVFDTPKPLKLTKQLIKILCPPDGIVLDAFGGSATTAHAVLELNLEGDSRSFILIELNDYAESISAERIRRVIEGDWAYPTKETKPLGGSFSFFEYKPVTFCHE